MKKIYVDPEIEVIDFFDTRISTDSGAETGANPESNYGPDYHLP